MFKLIWGWRSLSAFVHDVCAVTFAWLIAYVLRFNFDIPSQYTESLVYLLMWVVPVQMVFFILFGLYRGIWRFASLPDLRRILLAIGASTLAVAGMLFMLEGNGDVNVPRSALIMAPIVLLLLMGGSRFIYRSWKEHRLYGPSQLRGEPVLILGAGNAAVLLLKDLERSLEWQVLGLLDDDKAIHGREVHGVKVLGELAHLSIAAERLGVTHVIVAMPSAENSVRRRAVEIATQCGLQVLTVPQFSEQALI